MKYQTILMDADGTLFDFLRGESEAIRDAMTLNGIEPDDEKVATYSRINDSLWKALERGEIEKKVLYYHRFELFAEHYGLTLDPHKMASDYMARLATKGYLYDGAMELCRALSQTADIYIVTNGAAMIQAGRFERSGLLPYLKGVFISDPIGAEKPSTVYFDYVASHIEGFDPRRAVIVGDSLTSDIRGGINYGIDTVWYAPTGKEAPVDMTITCVARHYDDIYRFITQKGQTEND